MGALLLGVVILPPNLSGIVTGGFAKAAGCGGQILSSSHAKPHGLHHVGRLHTKVGGYIVLCASEIPSTGRIDCSPVGEIMLLIFRIESFVA